MRMCHPALATRVSESAIAGIRRMLGVVGFTCSRYHRRRVLVAALPVACVLRVWAAAMA